jgi:hypothetical protein
LKFAAKGFKLYLLLTFSHFFAKSIRSAGPEGMVGREITSVDTSEEPFYANQILSGTPQETISQQEDNSNISRLLYFFFKGVYIMRLMS